MSLKSDADPSQFYASISLRTMLLSVAAIAVFLGLAGSKAGDFGRFAPFAAFALMITQLGLMSMLFASLADDVWRDPGSTFVAGVVGMFGYSAIVALLLVW